MICATFNNWKRHRLLQHRSKICQAPPTGSLQNTVNQPISAHFQHFCSWECPLNVVKIVLDPLSNEHPLFNRRPKAPYENCTKLLGISKKGENHSIHSVNLAWFIRGFEYFNNPEGGFWHRGVRIWEERYRSVDGLDAIFKLLIFFAEISFVEWYRYNNKHLSLSNASYLLNAPVWTHKVKSRPGSEWVFITSFI